MVRKRSLPENKSLPRGWRFRKNFYWYQVPKSRRKELGYEVKLGRTLREAYQFWATICEPDKVKTFNDLMDRYMSEVVPKKKPSSQRSNQNSEKFLRAAFGKSNPAAIKPIDIYQYKDFRSKQGKTTANRDLEMLSHIFTKAIEWGIVEDHPMKGKVVKNSTKARDRLITSEEFDLFYNDYASTLIKAYIVLKLIIPLRKGDILRIKRSDLKADGIHAFNSKCGRKIVFEWSDDLKKAIENVLAVNRKSLVSLYIFSNRKGQPYINEDDGTTYSFNSIWQRCMKKFKDDGNEGFWEHDIRAMAASESESLERAQALLNHSSIAVTRKHYRRNVERIKPHQSKTLDGKL